MPFQSQRAELVLDRETAEQLQGLSRSRNESSARVTRAKMLLMYAEGQTVSAIARQFRTTRPKVERCIDKALQLGAMNSLEDLPRSGRPAAIDDEAIAWVVSLACQKPKDLGYPYELWTTRLLAKHVQKHCREAGHRCLARLNRGTVSKILTKNKIRPHRIKYYLEQRDPEFDKKMAQVLHVYKQVELLRESNDPEDSMTAILSYDEKPGIQAIENTAPDLPPKAGEHECISRDHEYIRHGTVSLMAGIDLLTGKVYGQVVERHRSLEFIQFLKLLDKSFDDEMKIRIVLDNHSAHISKETRAYLDTVPNRFDFVFTPTHGSWLNLIESFFSKMARTMLRSIRVSSKDELKKRILDYLRQLNKEPVIFRWKYGMNTVSAAS